MDPLNGGTFLMDLPNVGTFLMDLLNGKTFLMILWPGVTTMFSTGASSSPAASLDTCVLAKGCVFGVADEAVGPPTWWRSCVGWLEM